MPAQPAAPILPALEVSRAALRLLDDLHGPQHAHVLDPTLQPAPEKLAHQK